MGPRVREGTGEVGRVSETESLGQRDLFLVGQAWERIVLENKSNQFVPDSFPLRRKHLIQKNFGVKGGHQRYGVYVAFKVERFMEE